jgi:hypothetical protein
MLRTSINMSHAVFVKIALAAVKLGTSRREVVIMLLRRILRDIDRYKGGSTLVRYQPPDPLKQWHCFPICFKKNENEFATDFRKLSRFSVSYLVAIATKRYLDELLRDSASVHNYGKFPDYAIGRRRVAGIMCWEMYWGDTKNLPKGAPPPKIYRRASSH